MNIITISREFGSGGREVAKRLADYLGYDYYDREIIQKIAENQHMDRGYVENVLENGSGMAFPITFRNTFMMSASVSAKTSLLLEEKKVLEEIAKRGKDCIIVGRNADVILQEYHPFNIFVYADLQAKMTRCKDRAPQGEHLSEKELKQKMQTVDKARKETRMIVTNRTWGDKESYHLMVNTTGWEIKNIIPSIAAFTNAYFKEVH